MVVGTFIQQSIAYVFIAILVVGGVAWLVANMRRAKPEVGAEVEGNVLVVNTGAIIQGPPIGVNTTGQEAEGPHCIGSGGGGH